MRRQVPFLAISLLLMWGWARAEFVPDPRILPDDYTVLMAWDATRSPDLKRFQPGGHGKFFVRGWSSADQCAAWEVTSPSEDGYVVNVLIRRNRGGALTLEVTEGNQRATALLATTARGWQRLELEGALRLPRGRARIELRLRNSEGNAAFEADVLSIELVRPSVRDRLHASAMKLRSDTHELQNARFGFMFHWTSETWPRRGERKPYAQAVRDFKVEALADQVKEGGAGFVVLTTSHAYQYFPAPIKSLERIIPGRTSQRDLVGELAGALQQRGIRLWLYYHLGASQDAAWMKASGFFETDTTRFFGNWCDIVNEVGLRYGDQLAGWWFDDGTVSYYYRSAPWERLANAAKAGNPARLIGFNPWELPAATQFQDFCCGEGFSDPSVGGAVGLGGNGRFTRGPHTGLQACATLITERDWGHWQRDSEIAMPRKSAAETAAILKAFAARRNVPIFNLEIYQDGTCSPASIEMFRDAGKLFKQ